MATVLTWCFSFQMGNTSEIKYQSLHVHTDFFTVLMHQIAPL